MVNLKQIIILLFALFLVGCESSHYCYPGHFGTITEHENFIRHNPHAKNTEKSREKILEKAALKEPWNELNRYMAQFDDIEGASYDEENGRLIIWGPQAQQGQTYELPPLLLDDFAVALTVLQDGRNPGVSIGTISGRVPTQEDIERTMRTRKLPVEYIPPSIHGTHMGSVLFEIDRCLKGLAHGEDNLSRQTVTSSVPGYLPVSRRLQHDDTWEEGKARPLGLWWFVPDETGVAFEGYTIKFVRYRMRVEYRSLVDDPAIGAFGDHLNERFDEFEREIPLFRELVRLHKLVQIARWYKECGFPTENFQQLQRLSVKTPPTTKMIETLATSKRIPGPYPGSYYIQQTFLIGGIDLSPRNYYIPALSLPVTNLAPGRVTHWQPTEIHSAWRSPSPPHYGSFTATPAPLPQFARPIFQARPAATSYGWPIIVKDNRRYVAISIPMTETRGL